MSTARKIVECAKALDTMKECIINNNFRYEEVEDLDFFVNGIKDSVNIIHDWINGVSTLVEETESIEEIIESEEETESVISGFNLIESIVNEAAEEVIGSSVTENVTTKPRHRPRRSQKDLGYDEIGKYIANHCNHFKEIDVVNRCLEVFPEIGKQNVRRFISKISNTKISDKYFKVVDGIIVSTVKQTKETIEKQPDVLSASAIMDKMFDKEKFIRTCSKLPNEFRDEILVELYNNDFNLKKIDLSNYDVSRLTAMETVKRAAVAVMNIDCVLDGIDCCIMISSAVTSCGKKRVQKIVNFITKIWNWGSVSDSDIYDVINKKIYPEISDKFFK